MKKLYISIFTAIVSIVSVNAQAPHFQLYEHFTQASCGPCAAQNPGFQDSILNPNTQIVRHIAYHTSWPGTDPMYTHSPDGVNNRVGYYNISGVPHVQLDGSVKDGGPASFTKQDVKNAWSKTSALKVIVTHTDAGNVRTVNVEVKAVGTLPIGNYKLKTMMVERLINYTSAPGNNGETAFPNVYRKALPDTAGESITIPAVGASISFSYTVTLNSVWNVAQMAEVAFVQRENDKLVINSGASYDPIINSTIIHPTTDIKNGAAGTILQFPLTIGNSGTGAESFTYTLTTNAPSNWAGQIAVNGVTSGATTTQTVGANATLPVNILVTPGATPAIASYTLTITSNTNTTSPPISSIIYVVSGVRDLVVSNNSGRGDANGQTATAWESVFTNALNTIGANMMAKTTSDVMDNAVKNNAMQGVKNIYFNCGWTFPAFTDSMASRFINFMSGGGNVFMSGQDIAWEVFDSTNANNTYTTQFKRDFMRHFMNVDYLNDGASSSTTLSTIANDEIFTATTTGTISNFYGGTNMFPDELKIYGIGKSIYYYNTVQTKIGGIRSYNGISKTVHIAPGMEMLDVAKANYILTQSYKWFNGLVSVEEYDNAMLQIGAAMPNPASNVVFIKTNNANKNATIQFFDIAGKVVYTHQINGNEISKIDVSNFSNGIYFYDVAERNGAFKKQKLVIQK